MKTSQAVTSPVQPGKTVIVFPLESRAADTYSSVFSIDSAGLLFSTWVSSISGNVDIEVFTIAEDGRESSILVISTISSPSSSLLISPVRADFLSNIRVQVTSTGISTFEIRARAVPANLGELGNQGCHRILDEILVDAGGTLLINADACVAIVISDGTHQLHVDSVSTAEFN